MSLVFADSPQFKPKHKTNVSLFRKSLTRLFVLCFLAIGFFTVVTMNTKSVVSRLRGSTGN